MKSALPRPCLMLVTDRKQCRKPLTEIVRQAVEGSVDIIQLREKDLSAAELFRLAWSLRGIINGRTKFMVNDNPRLATACRADGVHLPENGLSVMEARKIVGDQALIGKSTHSVNGAVEAAASGADYVVLGTIYATTSKPGIENRGTGLIAQTAGAVNIPILAIGGVTKERVPEVIRAGAAGIAVCSAILSAEDPLAACRELRSVLDCSPYLTLRDRVKEGFPSALSSLHSGERDFARRGNL